MGSVSGLDAALAVIDDAIAGIGGLYRIDEIELAEAAATIDFSAIPADYTHLLIEGQVRSTLAGTFDSLFLAFNGDVDDTHYRMQARQTANNAQTGFQGLGLAGTRGVLVTPAAGSAAGDPTTFTIRIPNYRSVALTKAAIGHQFIPTNRTTGALFDRTGGLLWPVGVANVPIDRVTLSSSALFAAGSMASLYGVRSAVPL